MKRHFENLVTRAARAVKHWWLMLIAGLLCIAMSIAVFAFPMESYVVLSILFGVLMFIVGAVQLFVASASRNYLAMRGYIIVGGVLDVILGIFLCTYTGASFVLLPVMMGLWLMYHSFMIIAFGGDMETFKIRGSGITIVGGVLLLMLSILVLVNPLGAGIPTVITFAGIGLMLAGILMVLFSMKMKYLHMEITD